MKKNVVIAAVLAALWLAVAGLLVLPASADDETAIQPSAQSGPPDLLASGITLVTSDHKAYIAGSDAHFNPSAHLTRDQAAQILFRLLSQKVPITATFTDIPSGAWYAEAANTLGTLGVMRPGESTFRAGDEVTRGEFVRCVASFYPMRTDATQFTDVPTGHPDGAYFLSARAWGWLAGFSDGTARPDLPITRAEAVSLLNRALGRSPDKAYIDSTNPVFYWDVPKDSWYYYDVVEASVSHEHTGNIAAEQWTGCTPIPAGLPDGFQMIDGWLYYFDSARNDIVRSASVGSFDFDAKGHFTSGNEELDGLLHDIYLENTNEDMTREEKLRALYLYTRDSFSYLRRAPYKFGVLDFMEKDALTILTTGYGNCYCYASVFWYLSRWIGYDARIVNGTVGVRKSPHSWVEITFDGKSYIFDTELEMAYLKKGQSINMYKWTGSGWNYVR